MPHTRTLDAGLHLLDRQIVDCDGRLAGNVDDLHLEVPDDGGLPVVAGIVSGPGALAERLGGRLGRAWAALHKRMRPGGDPDTDVDVIPFSDVTRLSTQIDLAVPARQLESHATERWLSEHVISKIPGAGDAAE
jgi:hypothetical protein